MRLSLSALIGLVAFGCASGARPVEQRSTTIANQVIDVRASLQELSSHPAVDASRIGVIGHSEGALVGAVLASDTSAVSFVVTLAGPAIPITELLEDQAAGILRMSGAGQEQIAGQRRIQQMTYEAARTGEGWTEVGSAIERQVRAAVEALPPAQRTQILDIEALVSTQVTQQLSAAQTPWYQSLLLYEPEPTSLGSRYRSSHYTAARTSRCRPSAMHPQWSGYCRMPGIRIFGS